MKKILAFSGSNSSNSINQQLIEAIAKMDAENPKVQEWENLMWNFQQALPWAAPGEKWTLCEKVYKLPQD